MTKKDYILIADAIYGTHPRIWAYPALNYQDAEEQWLKTAERMAFKLAKDNPKFDSQKFLDACGIECEHDWRGYICIKCYAQATQHSQIKQ